MTIRPATDLDIPAILALSTQSLGDVAGMRTEAFWRWKHQENPFGQSPVLVACEGDEVIGLRAFMAWRFKYRDKTFKAYRAVDTATHPKHQGKGIFTKLTLALLDQIKAGEPTLIYNTPNHKSMPGYLKMGWQGLGNTRLRVKVYPLNIFAHQVSSRSPQVPDPVSFPDDLEDLLMHGSKERQNELNTDYSRNYLHWRYQQIPGLPYGLKSVKKGNGQALVIYRLKSYKRVLELRLVDIFYHGSDKKAVIRAAIHELAETYRPGVITTLADAGGKLDTLLPAGFFKAEKKGLTITGRKVNDDSLADLLNDPTPWNLSAGTLELF